MTMMMTFRTNDSRATRSQRPARQLLLPVYVVTLAVSLAGCEQVVETTAAVQPVEVVTTKSGLEMVLVPGSSFQMGSTHAESDESPPHQVTVDPFMIDRFEVTQAEYDKYVIGNPSKFRSPQHPVECVRWIEAALYCNGRSASEGLKSCYDEETFECDFEANGYRLPTEAEWEYACRAGTKTDYSFEGGEQKLAEYAWFKGDSAERTHPVGTKKPNPWGLYDMHGNVGEWCHDLYDGKFYTQKSGTNPCNLTGEDVRSLRGGSWNSPADRCRSACRSGEEPGNFVDTCFTRRDIGFRCVRRP